MSMLIPNLEELVAPDHEYQQIFKLIDFSKLCYRHLAAAQAMVCEIAQLPKLVSHGATSKGIAPPADFCLFRSGNNRTDKRQHP